MKTKTVRTNASMSAAMSLPILSLWRTLLLFLVLSQCNIAYALTNITIDETSPLITYTPANSWSRITGDLDAGGGHMLASDPGASASITFRFVSFYLLSARWPYNVSTQLTISTPSTTRGAAPTEQTMLLDLQDHTRPDIRTGPPSQASSVVFVYRGTETTNTERTLRLSVPRGGLYAVLDRIVFEVEDNSTTTSASTTSSSRTSVPIPIATPSASSQSSTTTSSPSSTPSKSKSSKSSKTLSITLGILGPILALLAAFLIYFLCYVRRRKQLRHKTWYDVTSRSGGGYPSGVYASGGRGGGGYEDEKAAFALSSPTTGRFDGAGSTTPRPGTPTGKGKMSIELLKSSISKPIPQTLDGPYTATEANHITYADPDNSFTRDSNAHDPFSSPSRGPSPLFNAYPESTGGQTHVKAPSIPPRLITPSPTPTFTLAGMELSASGVKGRGSPFPWSTKASTGIGGKSNTKHQHLQSTSSFGDASTDYHDYAFTYGVGGPSSSPTTRSQFSPHPYSSGYKPGPLAGGSRSYGHGYMGSVGSVAGSASLAGSVDYHNNFDHGSFTSTRVPTPMPMMSVAQAAAMSVRGPAPVWEPYVPRSASTSPTPTTPGGTQGMSGMGMAL